MFNNFKTKLMNLISILFFCSCLLISFNIRAQSGGGCESCGGSFGDNSCYNVGSGAISCIDTGLTCYNDGECEDGDPVLERA